MKNVAVDRPSQLEAWSGRLDNKSPPPQRTLDRLGSSRPESAALSRSSRGSHRSRSSRGSRASRPSAKSGGGSTARSRPATSGSRRSGASGASGASAASGLSRSASFRRLCGAAERGDRRAAKRAVAAKLHHLGQAIEGERFVGLGLRIRKAHRASYDDGLLVEVCEITELLLGCRAQVLDHDGHEVFERVARSVDLGVREQATGEEGFKRLQKPAIAFGLKVGLDGERPCTAMGGAARDPFLEE